ncbi:hypothetical protein [Shimia aestuarii]|uniref:Uncharacterized protein n=1 Tax=Shimia aestuarii TaxID=254406 RepID=A0A1I4N6G4_9RHOB|nr:hypothetical protein [Shimia aestuarii]SFM10926.1 hypothetical protein SAMN04488042_1046 [Shimia aestuarii]
MRLPTVPDNAYRKGVRPVSFKGARKNKYGKINLNRVAARNELYRQIGESIVTATRKTHIDLAAEYLAKYQAQGDFDPVEPDTAMVIDTKIQRSGWNANLVKFGGRIVYLEAPPLERVAEAAKEAWDFLLGRYEQYPWLDSQGAYGDMLVVFADGKQVDIGALDTIEPKPTRITIAAAAPYSGKLERVTGATGGLMSLTISTMIAQGWDSEIALRHKYVRGPRRKTSGAAVMVPVMEFGVIGSFRTRAAEPGGKARLGARRRNIRQYIRRRKRQRLKGKRADNLTLRAIARNREAIRNE